MKNLLQHPNWRKYEEYLSTIGSLSRLFSDSDIPFIYYRAMENIFCHSFSAVNLSRNDLAYDAIFQQVGLGLKTFTCDKNVKLEKIAEFNKLSQAISKLKVDPESLIKQLATYRNQRILFANNTYGVSKAFYHCIARQKGKIALFSEEYRQIDTDSLKLERNKPQSIGFSDRFNEYSYLYSKSTLFKRFYIPNDAHFLDIKIIENPYDLITELFSHRADVTARLSTLPYIILPLYSTKGSSGKFVPERSGLNQWNGGGRPRGADEVYIRVPRKIHEMHPGFLPPRHQQFELKLPTGKTLTASVCQAGDKAIMTNPNEDLGKWLLRTLLRLKRNELATYSHLAAAGADCVRITKHEDKTYSIDFDKMDAYEDFLDADE